MQGLTTYFIGGRGFWWRACLSGMVVGLLGASLFSTLHLWPQLVAFLPTPWNFVNIGGGQANGMVSYERGMFLVKSTGHDVWGTADRFTYNYQTLRGNGQIVTRLVSQSSADGWAKAGVMIRESLKPESAYALLALTPTNGASFQWRVKENDMSHTSPANPAFRAPCWIKLARTDDRLVGYVSDDGLTYIEVGMVSLALKSDVWVGLAVTAHSADQEEIATFG